MRNIALAERLGAETVSLSGSAVADEILEYARSHGVTRIVIGKSGEARWRLLLRRSIVDKLLRSSGDIDIHIVQGVAAPDTTSTQVRIARGSRRHYAGALGAVIVACLVALVMQEFGLSEANKAVVFMPAVVAAAMWWGLGPGVAAAVASVVAFDFFFVRPYFTLAVQDIEYVVTLLVLAAVALLVGTLGARLRRQVRTSRTRERRLEVLSRLGRGLSGASGIESLTRVAETELAGIFGGPISVYLVGSDGKLAPTAQPVSDERRADKHLAAAAWAFDHGEMVGPGTEVLSDSGLLHVPMTTTHGTIGVLSVGMAPGSGGLSPGGRQLLETAATQMGSAIEREMLADRSRRASLEAEREGMRSALLSSVSHDLRTPLAVIAGTTSTLLELGSGADPDIRTALLREVHDESDRLTRLVENLLAMTRFDSGVIEVDKQWFPVEDVIGSALGRLRGDGAGRVIEKHIPDDLPVVPLDGVMIEQVLFNLVDNAMKYSDPGSPIDISVSCGDDFLSIEVADRGAGLAENETVTVFDKLYRGSASVGSARGAGLGLAIAKAIIRTHGGEIWAGNRDGGGATFTFTLPLGTPPDDMTLDNVTESEEGELT
jgi:two-component system sensor histidine kinase KdpD